MSLHPSSAETRQTNHGSITPRETGYTTDHYTASYRYPQTREAAKRLLVPELRMYDTHGGTVEIPGMSRYPPKHDNMIRMATSRIFVEGNYDKDCCIAGDEFSQYPWLCPHNQEAQKHAWHKTSLGMTAKIQDEWGFSSTGGSRSETPKPEVEKEKEKKDNADGLEGMEKKS